MKHLKVSNEASAKAKSRNALNRKSPNRNARQLELHQANPLEYPPPSACSQYLFGWREDKQTGECELDIPDDKVQFLTQDDQGAVTDVKQIEDNQGEDEQ